MGCAWSLVSMGRRVSPDTLSLVAGVVAEDIRRRTGGAAAPVDHGMVCNFLTACARCRYSPHSLLEAYSGHVSRCWLPPGDGAEEQRAAAPSPSAEGGRQRGAGRGEELTAAAFALGLHRHRDPGLWGRLEGALIKQQSTHEGLSPAQVSRKQQYLCKAEQQRFCSISLLKLTKLEPICLDPRA